MTPLPVVLRGELSTDRPAKSHIPIGFTEEQTQHHAETDRVESRSPDIPEYPHTGIGERKQRHNEEADPRLKDTLNAV